ncbi:MULTISPECIES: glycoside hydrolase family 20 protein [unclassified Streptomyces]|uniref:beta-N-acetylhexosaminidase n=1 Tax=unclassified Streptomyces TaxID=2593676 RepID=UPI003369BDF8
MGSPYIRRPGRQAPDRRTAGARTPAVTAVAAAVVTALALVTGCQQQGGDGGHPATTSHRPTGTPTTTTGRPPATPSPRPTTRSPRPPASPTALPAAPRTIPSVRHFAPAAGPGWRPGAGSRVVTNTRGPLADEAALTARELGLRVSSGPARRGDLELALNPKQSGGGEAYILTVRGGRARITGSSDAGVFYGTRTVKQALRSGGRVPQGVIRDAPDRSQRGLNLDIARKYFSASWIEARLREMADLKLNQLGLHFSDDQAFRIQSSSHPEIVAPQHLTKQELRRIVGLAQSLHITVVPEIDSPGHLGAVIRAHPALQLRTASGAAFRGAVDISNPVAGRIVDDLMREFAPLFPGRYWHLGGDEYGALMSRNPEATYPALATAARLAYGPRGRIQDLATAWLNARAAVARELGKQPKAWNDGFFTGGVVTPDRSIQVEYWTGREGGARPPAEYLREGRTVVNLNDEYLYYVLGQPNNFLYPTGERIYDEWSPAVLRGTRPVPDPALTGPARVQGARFAVWCDIAGAQTQKQVADGIRLPLAALAQRLWDPGKPPLSWKDFTALSNRLTT